MKVKKHLNDKCDLHKATLQTASDTHAWYELAKATLVLVMLFNRRRSGEIERITLNSYQHITNTINKDVIVPVAVGVGFVLEA